MKNSYNMLRHKILICVIAIFFSVLQVSGQTKPKAIHLIKIFDFYTEIVDNNGVVKSDKIYPAAKKFESYINSKALKIANELKIPVKQYDFSDESYISDPLHSKFSKYAIQDTIRKMTCKGDIVIIAVLCHGFSTNIDKYSNDSITYPSLILNYSGDIAESMPYSDILCNIQQKQPSLVLSIVSTCQELIKDEVAVNIQKRYNGFLRNFNNFSIAGTGESSMSNNIFAVRSERINELFNINNYNKHLQDNFQTVTIDLLSCQKGEYTYIDEEGGHFLSSFMSSFDESLSSKKELDWLQVATLTKSKTVKTINDYNNYLKNKNSNEFHIQSPQCFVSVKSNICSDKPHYISTTKVITKPDDNPTGFFVYEDYVNRKIKTPYNLAVRFVKLGESYRDAKEPNFAIKTLDVAIEVLEKSNDKYVLATGYEKRGLAYRDLGDKEKAKIELQKARKIFADLNCKGSVSAIDILLKSL